MRRIIAILIATLYGCVAIGQVGPGDTPPDALGTTFGGNAVTLSSLHGKVVVISFWATWCGYCMQEMPVLAKLQLVATERKLPLQVVSVNYREDHDTFLRTARLLHKRLPSLMLSWDRDGHVGKHYGTAGGIPVMVMLHRDGTVAHVHIGYGADMLDSLLAEINELLREPAPSVVALAR
jgi:thiol-disulfide isomerase/thioredoxin